MSHKEKRAFLSRAIATNMAIADKDPKLRECIKIVNDALGDQYWHTYCEESGEACQHDSVTNVTEVM